LTLAAIWQSLRASPIGAGLIQHCRDGTQVSVMQSYGASLKWRMGSEREYKAYGSAQTNFTCIAEMWSAYLAPHKVSPRDVANLMALLKLARMKQSSGGHRDSSLDAAAYCALAHELDQTT
jgi:hypothetical protein